MTTIRRLLIPLILLFITHYTPPMILYLLLLKIIPSLLKIILSLLKIILSLLKIILSLLKITLFYLTTTSTQSPPNKPLPLMPPPSHPIPFLRSIVLHTLLLLINKSHQTLFPSPHLPPQHLPIMCLPSSPSLLLYVTLTSCSHSL